MTGQISDSLRRDDERYAIAAIENEWPFSPKAHGLVPVATSTACWRGFHVDYALQSTQLVLDTLSIGLGKVPPPEWQGVAAVRGQWWEYESFWEYAHVGLPIPYSGRIVIAKDLVRDHYIHMGFQRPWAYRDVRELKFDDGRLLEERDHSVAMERIRRHLPAVKAAGEDLEEFVRQSFSTSYADKWLIDRMV